MLTENELRTNDKQTRLRTVDIYQTQFCISDVDVSSNTDAYGRTEKEYGRENPTPDRMASGERDFCSDYS